MTVDDSLPNRHARRHPLIDYTRGGFFITICLARRVPRFGSVDSGQMNLNAAGEMIEKQWLALPNKFPGLVLDSHIVMPDHLHAVICLVEPFITDPSLEPGRPRPSLPAVVGSFKSTSTIENGRGVRAFGWPTYEDKLWQPGYWDHQLRDERDFESHRSYVFTNPERWELKRQGIRP
jgi:REP element-mobilizing transposase RayT